MGDQDTGMTGAARNRRQVSDKKVRMFKGLPEATEPGSA